MTHKKTGKNTQRRKKGEKNTGKGRRERKNTPEIVAADAIQKKRGKKNTRTCGGLTEVLAAQGRIFLVEAKNLVLEHCVVGLGRV